MLGKQQIAGIPTAISELFKNAHDAYADRVEADFLRAESLFVLRDDGVGMSRADFETRWLTLGTESKINSPHGLRPPPIDSTKATRPVLGEKGIGRLAMSSIGPQVLVLTRAQSLNRGERAPLVVSFVHWGLFALAGLSLDQIEVPVLEWQSDDLPDTDFVGQLVGAVRENFTSLTDYADAETAGGIFRDLDSFRLSPANLASHLEGPSLSQGGHGCQFYIHPVDEGVTASLARKDDATAPPLTRFLIGFANTMTPGHEAPRIRTAFRDHLNVALVRDLIEEHEFFTPEEFEEADHHIAGTFDGFGQFVGTVTVYGEPSVNHVVSWNAGGKPSRCGPFSITFAVVQGAARESTVPQDRWVELTNKMNQLGGLYIYKDGIRVLPYGNTDYDFLDIEKNRTKQASYYYFSYRRMFGAIEIDSVNNSALREKAGREGFIENPAYRDFHAILTNFLVQIAADYFREGGADSSRFEERRAELDRIERARRAREKRITARRAQFRTRIESAFSALEAGGPEAEAAAVLSELRDNLATAANAGEGRAAVDAYLEAETQARKALADVRNRYRVVQPRGVGLSRDLRRDIELYKDRVQAIESEVFAPAVEEMEHLVAESTRMRSEIDRRLRFEHALATLAESARATTRTDSREVRLSADAVRNRATDLAREAVREVDHGISEALAEAARIDVSHLDDAEFVVQRTDLERRIEETVERQRSLLDDMTERLKSLARQAESPAGMSEELDASEALEEEVLALRERSESDLELAQLGMAIQVISHEFDATIRQVRGSVRELAAWADANELLQPLYDRIRSNFEHLDGYLTLFTPLQRRLYRQRVTVSGKDIAKFLNDLFEERLRRHEIALEVTRGFRTWHIDSYPSTFYPVFVNLVDNAIYWLSDRPEPRIVRLDAVGSSVLISDNGPGVHERDRESIFELGFTRKPGGRGMGLRIATDVLAREGFVLELDASPPAGMATAFRIRRAETED